MVSSTLQRLTPKLANICNHSAIIRKCGLETDDSTAIIRASIAEIREAADELIKLADSLSYHLPSRES